jgi:hypothetical protein
MRRAVTGLLPIQWAHRQRCHRHISSHWWQGAQRSRRICSMPWVRWSLLKLLDRRWGAFPSRLGGLLTSWLLHCIVDVVQVIVLVDGLQNRSKLEHLAGNELDTVGEGDGHGANWCWWRPYLLCQLSMFGIDSTPRDVPWWCFLWLARLDVARGYVWNTTWHDNCIG